MRFKRMLQLNVITLTSLTRLALPEMQARGWGRILNVGSVVGYQPAGPRMAAYYASKAYVLSFSKGLARELKGTGVSVTALCPGPTKSSFEERSGADRTILYKIRAEDDSCGGGTRRLPRHAAPIDGCHTGLIVKDCCDRGGATTPSNCRGSKSPAPPRSRKSRRLDSVNRPPLGPQHSSRISTISPSPLPSNHVRNGS